MNTIPTTRLHQQATNETDILGQLTLVEHSLCPLRPPKIGQGYVHRSRYFYYRHRERRAANVVVSCPAGLSPQDEFYLWGLLSICASQSADNELHATPHYCLRQLGIIDEKTRRGGRQYRQFKAALKRLSAVSYQCDAFYDPIRKEHRQVSFGFLSYSLPVAAQTSRAWRIVWDPLFYELTQAVGGHMSVDLTVYRSLNEASRRMFLLLVKIYRRRVNSPSFDLQHLACDVLGFSASRPLRNLKRSVVDVLLCLREKQIVEFDDERSVFRGNSTVGITLCPLRRGKYFVKRRKRSPIPSGPFSDALLSLGFAKSEIGRIQSKYQDKLLREWIDVTLAAKERHGLGFFKRSPQAYLIDNLKHATAGTRTPPDWWWEIRRQEDQSADRPFRAKSSQPQSIADIMEAVFPDFTSKKPA